LSRTDSAALDGFGAVVDQTGKTPRLRLEHRRSDYLGPTRHTADGPERAATDVPYHDDSIAGCDCGGRLGLSLASETLAAPPASSVASS